MEFRQQENSSFPARPKSNLLFCRRKTPDCCGMCWGGSPWVVLGFLIPVPFHDSAPGMCRNSEPSLIFLMSWSLWDDGFKGIQGRINPIFLLLCSANHKLVLTTLTSAGFHSLIFKFMQSGARWDSVVKLLTVLRMNC